MNSFSRFLEGLTTFSLRVMLALGLHVLGLGLLAFSRVVTSWEDPPDVLSVPLAVLPLAAFFFAVFFFPMASVVLGEANVGGRKYHFAGAFAIAFSSCCLIGVGSSLTVQGFTGGSLFVCLICLIYLLANFIGWKIAKIVAKEPVQEPQAEVTVQGGSLPLTCFYLALTCVCLAMSAVFVSIIFASLHMRAERLPEFQRGWVTANNEVLIAIVDDSKACMVQHLPQSRETQLAFGKAYLLHYNRLFGPLWCRSGEICWAPNGMIPEMLIIDCKPEGPLALKLQHDLNWSIVALGRDELRENNASLEKAKSLIGEKFPDAGKGFVKYATAFHAPVSPVVDAATEDALKWLDEEETPPPPSPLQSSEAAQILSQPSSSRSRWHKYRGPDGRFEMLMPGKPDSRQEQGFEVFEADDDFGAVRLMVGDNPEGITEFTPERIKGANRYMESYGYKFKEKLRLNGHPVLSYSMPRMDSPLKELKDIKASGEILFTFTKKNVYMVFIVQPDGAEKSRRDWKAKIVSSIKLKD